MSSRKLTPGTKAAGILGGIVFSLAGLAVLFRALNTLGDSLLPEPGGDGTDL